MNKNNILSGGWKNLTGGGKWGWRGREVGGEGEGSGVIGIRPQLFPLIGCIENGYNSTQDSSLFNGL